MRLTKLFLSVCFILLSAVLKAQNQQELIDQCLQYQATKGSLESVDELTPLLEELMRKKVPARLEKMEEIMSIPILEEAELNALRAHMIRFGAIKSKYELMQIKALNKEVLKLLPHFLLFDSKGQHTKLTIENGGPVSGEVLSRIKRQFISKGERHSRPWSTFQRLQLRYRSQLTAGISLEKDEGEGLQLIKGTTFRSFHLFYEAQKDGLKIALGDYKFQSGQGRMYSSGLSLGKMRLSQGASRLQSYRSANEFNFLRGAAFTKPYKNGRLYVGYSSKKLDGSIDSTSYTINTSGYHRSESEINRRGAIRERLSFIQFAYSPGRSHIACLLNFRQLSSAVERGKYQHREWTQLFNFKGPLGPFYTFGELAIQYSGQQWLHSLSAGLLIVPHPAIDLGILFRKYEKGFTSAYGSPFSERASADNEEGLYVQLLAKPFKNSRLKLQVDLFKLPDWHFPGQRPEQGKEVRLSYNYRKKGSALQFRISTKQGVQDYLEHGQLLKTRHPQRKTNIRIHFNKSINKQTDFSCRMESTTYESTMERKSFGILCYQQLTLSSQKQNLRLHVRYTLFKTDNYKSRLYAYENDLLYSFSIPAYYGSGQSAFVMMKYKMRHHWRFWFRYAYLMKEPPVNQEHRDLLPVKQVPHTFKLQMQFVF